MNEDKLRFINRNWPELEPLVRRDSILLSEISQDRTDFIIERYSSRIWFKDLDRSGINFYCCVADLGSLRVIKPLIEALANDSRVGSITLIAHGIAGHYYLCQDDFQLISGGSTTILTGLLAHSLSYRPDVIVASVSVSNGPESVLLYNGKSLLGAKKLYVIVDGWTGIGHSLTIQDQNQFIKLDNIDGIICNDEFAKEVVLAHCPHFPEKQVYSFGTPSIDYHPRADGRLLRDGIRNKLGIDNQTLCLLFLGGVQTDFEKLGIPAGYEKYCLSKTVMVLRELTRQTGQKIAFIFRAHQRDSDRQQLLDAILPLAQLTEDYNLAVINGLEADVNLEESIQAADILVSLQSSEIFKCPYKGKVGIFLNYAFAGIRILDHFIGSKLVTKIPLAYENVYVADSPSDLITKLARNNLVGVAQTCRMDSIPKILNLIFQ